MSVAAPLDLVASSKNCHCGLLAILLPTLPMWLCTFYRCTTPRCSTDRASDIDYGVDLRPCFLHILSSVNGPLLYQKVAEQVGLVLLRVQPLGGGRRCYTRGCLVDAVIGVASWHCSDHWFMHSMHEPQHELTRVVLWSCFRGRFTLQHQ